MIPIVKRNVKLFFRDKLNVFFSLLSVLIIVGLYVLFLGETIQSGNADVEGFQFVADSWIMAGVVAVSSITTTMGAFGVMVDDKANKISKDFSAAPIRNNKLAAGYIISSFVIGVLMSTVTFVLAEIYIVTNGGEWLDSFGMIKVLGIILLTVITSSSMMYFVTLFMESQNAFATASTIIGTIIGFLAGVYIPIGQFSEGIQTVIKFFPLTYSAVLMRKVMMEEPMDIAFEGAPAEAVEDFSLLMGRTIQFGDMDVTPLICVLILLGTTALFYGLSVVRLSVKRR